MVIGTRDPDGEGARKAHAALGPSPRAAQFSEAAAGAALAVLATSWSGTESAIRLSGAANLAGKALIDATNPLDLTAGQALALGYSTSGAELIQNWLPQVRVVKAFNTVAAPLMVDPKVPGGSPSMFIAGNDPDAKRQVREILEQFGWEAIDIGGIDVARLLEPLAMLGHVLHPLRVSAWRLGHRVQAAGREAIAQRSDRRRRAPRPDAPIYDTRRARSPARAGALRAGGGLIPLLRARDGRAIRRRSMGGTRTPKPMIKA